MSIYTNLLYFNALNWNLAESPYLIRLNGVPVFHTSFLDLVFYTKNLVLMLPVNKVLEANKINIYFQVNIRKNQITFRDIIQAIYKFYYNTKISFDDFKYAALADTNKNFIPGCLHLHQHSTAAFGRLRFIGFLENQTNVVGLTHHRGNIFSLHLEELSKN